MFVKCCVSLWFLLEYDRDMDVLEGLSSLELWTFPLLSKSNCLQKIVQETNEKNADEVQLPDFPGGAKTFEICAKFCYGMTVTLNAYNVVATRCAAEYLEMSEAVEKGNLIYKIEVFLSSSIFRSWKDSIIVLRTAKTLLPWSEDLKIVGRCIDSIAAKTSVDPSKVDWSYSYNRKRTVPDIICAADNGIMLQQKFSSPAPKDWWIEDICELEIDLYERVMISIKSKGRMSGTVIGEALKIYILRWLPDFMNFDALVSSDDYAEFAERNRSLVETIIWLLPTDMGACCSCTFLLKLLKVAALLGTSEESRQDLVRRVGLQLDEASVEDLLIPSANAEGTVYDIDLVQSIVDKFVAADRSRRDPYNIQSNEGSTEHDYVTHDSWLNVGRLIDCCLAQVAHDPNVSLYKFISLSESVPDSARPVHDELYRAIDIYLKEHAGLTKGEKKRICSLMDVKKLSMDACVHAAQNERLPLRVVVQVLFFEQVKAAATMSTPSAHIRETRLIENGLKNRSCSVKIVDERWEQELSGCQALTRGMSSMKIRDDDSVKNIEIQNKKKKPPKKMSGKGGLLLPSRSRRIFDKLWANKGGHLDGKKSDNVGGFQSPISMHPGEAKSIASSSRYRRFSVS
ncbi:BTB/POZ domain-containing protein [Nymphaea thermarum]|nr:BTB/POZ domain-containing protein [Nymphaea thermarum]